MTAPWLVVGGSGQLARAFLQHFSEVGAPAIHLPRNALDLATPDALSLPEGPLRGVINCAAYTNVDGAETDEATATRVNGHSVARLAELSLARGVPFVTYSTDYVFDGRGTAPYSVGTPRNPLNAYGRSKAWGEEALERAGGRALLIRTSWVYAPYGNNFVRTMARLMKEKAELRVVDDQRGRPTHVRTLVDATLGLLEREATGTFHVTDDGECTWFEFARRVRELTGSACRVLPCTTEEFPRPAPRPKYSVLDTSVTEALLGAARPFEQRLAETIALLGDPR